MRSLKTADGRACSRRVSPAQIAISMALSSLGRIDSVQVLVRQLFMVKRHKLSPLFSPLQHLCNQTLAVSQASVAME